MQTQKLAILLCVFIIFFDADISAQKSEKGLPFIEYFSPSDYKAGSFNFNVIKDHLGVYYFSNKDGVLIYNGVDWELVGILHDKPVYWLQQGIDSVIYVGSIGELGCLKQSENGIFSYVSLMDKIDPRYHDFGPVWEISVTSRQIVFRTRKYLFVLVDDQINVIHFPKKQFDVAFTVGDTVYTRVRGVGLVSVENQSVSPLVGGEFFADNKVNAFLPYEDKLLVATRYDGLYTLSKDGTVDVFRTEADDFLKEYRIYHGCVTYNGDYAFAAYTKGVVIINSEGELIEQFDETTGLIDFQYLFVDMFDANNLWIANGVGTSKIEVLSPLSYYDNRSGLLDVATSAFRYQDDFYISTLRGLFQLKKQGNKNRFVSVGQEDYNEIYSLQLLNNELLVGAQVGLYQLIDNEVIPVNDRRVHYTKVIEDHVWVGTNEGGLGYYPDIDQPASMVSLDDFYDQVEKVVTLGDFVVMTSIIGDVYVIRIDEEGSDKKLSVIHKYSFDNVEVVSYQGTVLVITNSSYFIIDAKGNLSNALSNQLSIPNIKIECVSLLSDDLLWICYQDELRNNYCEQIQVSDTAIYAAGEIFNSEYLINSIYNDRDSVSWFMGDGGALRYDRKVAPYKSTEAFKCLIGSLMWGNDSLVFENGFGIEDFKIPFDNNDLRFSYFTNEINTSSQNMYQYYMVGRDQGWSEWSSEWKKDYTNLPSGDYIFHVRAKNALNQISNVDAFTFSVIGPWYLSTFSLFFFLIVFMLIVFGLYKNRTQKLKADKDLLEELVSERTIEVEEQKEDLETQRLVLQNANDSKNQLFSIIGHDLRSPLNSIQGLTDLIQHYQKEKKPELANEMMDHLSSSVKGLRHLLDNLLTWALNQSGNFKVNPELIKLNFFMKEAVSILIEAANAKEIKIELEGEPDCLLYADRNSMSTVIRNLINNAIKFSHKKDEIVIRYWCDQKHTTIEIIDRGVGIPASKLKDIYQLTTTTYGTNKEKGTGLGLVLVNEFVNLNGGTIHVSSQEEQGTTFTLKFPIK